MKKIVIIDYEVGNIKSIYNALPKNNLDISLSNNYNEILNADGIILPGVGAFSHAMKKLKDLDLVEPLKEYTDSEKPLLGICLGMQILFSESEEFGLSDGLGLISGTVRELPKKSGMKLPHISWAEIKSISLSWKDTILDGIPLGTEMYHVHSFYADPVDKEIILSISDYSGFNFCSSVKSGNIYGTQYHPEKSGKLGLKIIQNFVNIVSL